MWRGRRAPPAACRDGWRRGRGLGARAAMCLALLLLPVVGRASATAREVTVAIDDAKDACRVRGSFEVPVSSAVAWEVLTDYDHIDRFVASMRSSRVERGPDGRLRVRQDAVAGLFLLHRRVQVLLDVDEAPGRRIAFRDVLRRDFREYAGEWRIASDSTGTRVDYTLQAEPRGAILPALCRRAMRQTARDLLRQVRAEMMSRQARLR